MELGDHVAVTPSLGHGALIPVSTTQSRPKIQIGGWIPFHQQSVCPLQQSGTSFEERINSEIKIMQPGSHSGEEIDGSH